MKNGTLWKVIIKYPNGASVTKYKRAKELLIGSHHAAHIVMSKDYPEVVAKVSGECIASSLASEYKSTSKGKGIVVDSDKVSFEVYNVESEHKPVQFNESVVADPNSTSTEFALWHYVDNVLLETETVQALDQNQKDAYEIFSPMRSGISVQWQQLEQRLVIKYPNGEVRSVKVDRNDDGTFVGTLENEKFVLVRTNNEKYDFVPKDYEPESDPYNKYFMAFLASWFLLIGLVNFGAQFLPAIDEEQLAQEELPELMKKVEIAKAEMKENAKNGQGGNGMAGGGGVQDGGDDPRGGGGFVSDEVAVSNIQALSGSAGVFDAIGALDKRMAAKGAKTASLGPSNATANSILGALGALGSGKKKGGKGLGFGGVGTKGYGGGGGGGKGSGFGKGVGSGLGIGKGPRNLSFQVGDSNVQGGLSRSEVDAVVKQNLAQIRFCYNRGLRAYPDMSGRVVSNFVIAADGKVKTSRIKQSSLGAAEVENCIKSKVASWAFPQPRGGGEVVVNYPFLLRSN